VTDNSTKSAVVLDDERAAPVDARYVVIGYGETDHPQAAFANEREQLLDAVLGMMYTKASDADAEIQEAYAKDLADDDEWSHEGIWRTEFEIGGIVIYDLGPRAASPQATATQPAQTERALTDAKRLDWIDVQNAPLQMGWRVGVAPKGNVSISSVIQLGGKVTSIREAIDAAMDAAQPESGANHD
jgi:hypothetical protein